MTATARGRARSAVVAGFAAVLAAHAWLAVRVETDRPHWRDPEFFQRTRAAKELARSDSRPVLAILGGSRSQMGIDPERLPQDHLAFNFSQSGCLPVGTWLNFTRLHDEGLLPRRILIEVLPPVLADGGPAEARLASARLSASELERLVPFDADPEEARSEWRSSRVVPWLALRSPLRAAAGFEERLPPMSARGWSPAPKYEVSSDERERRFVLARGTYGWLLNDFAIHPANDRAFRMILDTCRERGIGAALFTMPESPRFRAWYSAEARTRIREWLRTVSEGYQVPVFDTSEWLSDEAAFLDGHHLQRAAAERFSERFNCECVEKWLASKP